jgi:replication factor C subunit 1
VDRFKPTSLNQIIGNNQSVKSLVEFLENWKDSQKQKAALISGPPGIGKTTTAAIVSQLCGYEVIEFNASDTRNQKSLEEHVSDMLDNRTITEFQTGVSKSKKSKKQVLVMDEVDGMSSGDRGGLTQLNKLIKISKVSQVVMCEINDICCRSRLFVSVMIEVIQK